jgi:EAL domain-containing protein (putative c-di-GMP-specific phosphodiesterase class I)
VENRRQRQKHRNSEDHSYARENLGIEVVAEGVESKEQLQTLRSLGCRLGQGFLFSRPITVRDVDKFISFRWRAISDL